MSEHKSTKKRVVQQVGVQSYTPFFYRHIIVYTIVSSLFANNIFCGILYVSMKIQNILLKASSISLAA